MPDSGERYLSTSLIQIIKSMKRDRKEMLGDCKRAENSRERKLHIVTASLHFYLRS